MKYITSLFLLLSLTTQAQNDWLRYSTLSAKGGINFANLSFRGDGDYDHVQKPYFVFVYTDYLYEFLAGKFELTYSGQGSKYKYSEKGINTSYSIPYLSVGYVMSFRFFKGMRLDCGGSLDFALSKDAQIPDQRMMDIAGFMGLEIYLNPQLSLEARIKGGRWSVTKDDYTREYPFRYEPKNVVYQVGLTYYFNLDVWKDKKN